jgi:hypothetical protein
VSRFRPGRRKDDRPEGDPFDGRDYAGDAYDEGPYRDDPLRGGYAAPDDSDSGGRARSDADLDDRSAEAAPARPHGPQGPRFRKNNDVLQPTSVISPGGLVGGPPDEGDPRGYDTAGPGFDEPAGYPSAPPYPPPAGYAYAPGYDQAGYGGPYAGPDYGAVPEYGPHHPDYGPTHGASAGYEAGAAYPPGPDSEVDPSPDEADGYEPLPPYAAPPEYRAGPVYGPAYYPPPDQGYYQAGPPPPAYYPQDRRGPGPGYPQDHYPAAGYPGPQPYDQGYAYGISEGEEFVPHSGSGAAEPSPGAPWGGLLATGPFPAAGRQEPRDYDESRGRYPDAADPRYPGPVPPRGYPQPAGGEPPAGYAPGPGYGPPPRRRPPRGYQPGYC